MTREEIIEMLDRRDKGWELRDPKVLAAPYAEDAVLESPISGTSTGRPEIEGAYERLLKAWSPLEHTREEVLVDGDRVLISNATGCSSIYGGNLPTTPGAVDESGRGPTWSNSLFEDNAEVV